MNTFHALLHASYIGTFLAFLIIAFVAFIASTPKTGMKIFANVGEGFYPGRKTYKADGAITPRYSLVKIGSDLLHVTLAGAADIPIGICTDEAAAAEDLVNVDLLGSAHETKLGVASGAIALGAFIVPDANGKVRQLPAGAGTYYIVGRALNSTAADGDSIAYDPVPCVQRVV